jgi:hypothetical protein
MAKRGGAAPGARLSRHNLFAQRLGLVHEPPVTDARTPPLWDPRSTKRAAYRAPSRPRLGVCAGVRGVDGDDRLRAGSGLNGVARGRTGFRAKADKRLRARNRLRRPKRAFIGAPVDRREGRRAIITAPTIVATGSTRSGGSPCCDPFLWFCDLQYRIRVAVHFD